MWGALFKNEYYKEEVLELSHPDNPHVFFDIKIGDKEP